MDLQQLIALQKASGGQNTITPENAGRIMGLAAQQEANRQLSMDAGKLAVEERKRLQEMQQGMTPGQISGSTIVAPSGARFVTDAKGNVVGMNAPGQIPGAMPIGNETQADAQKAFNRGEGTAAERELFSNSFSGTKGDMGLLRRTFINEMQSRAPTRAVPVPEEAPAQPTAQPPTVTPVAPPSPPNAAEVQRMQAEQRDLENRYASSGLGTPQELEESGNRAALYKQIQDIDRELNSGVQRINTNPYGFAAPQISSISPKQREAMSKQKDLLREKIRESSKKESEMAKSRQVPKDAMARYQAILDSLARVRK
jgi:hypothetical protein